MVVTGIEPGTLQSQAKRFNHQATTTTAHKADFLLFQLKGPAREAVHRRPDVVWVRVPVRPQVRVKLRHQPPEVLPLSAPAGLKPVLKPDRNRFGLLRG